MTTNNPISYFQDISTFLKALKTFAPQSNLFHIHRHEDVPGTHSEETQLFRTNTFSVSLLTDGEAVYKIGMQEYSMKPGSFYFMSPQQLRYYKKIRPWKGYVFVFSEEFIRMFSGISVYAEYPFFKLDANVQLHLNNEQLAELLPLLEKLHAYYNSNETDKLKYLFHYMSLVLLLARKWYAEQHTIVPETDKPVMLSKAFDDLLEKHFFDIASQRAESLLAVADFAAVLHVSSNYLSDTVKRETGKTPTQIIKERTILEAKSLLRNTRLTVSEVAYFLLFDDPSYFAKYFKAATGVSPSDFKDQK
jgi:AraC family transcriptional activator of pobA